MTDKLHSAHGCFVRRVLNDGHVSLLGTPTQKFDGHGEEKYRIA